MVLISVLFAFGCNGPLASGQIGDAPNSDDPSRRRVVTDPPWPSCDDVSGDLPWGTTPITRLTRTQYDATVSQLLNLPSSWGRDFTGDEKVGRFASNSIAPASELAVEQYLLAAIEAAEAASAGGFDGILPPECDGADDTACGRAFVAAFLPRAFRRPVTDEEVAAMVDLFDFGIGHGGRDLGLQSVIEGALSSPHFVYRPESGGENLFDATEGTEVALTTHELASRLSYALWQSMPDDELFARADDGTLSQPEVLEAQINRMIRSPQAKTSISTFAEQWLGVDGLENLDKLDGSFNVALASAMRTETGELAAEVVLNGSGLFGELFTTPKAVVTTELGEFYGVNGAEDGETVDLPTNERAGLLTRAAFLAAHAHPTETSPTHRGVAVREGIFCQILPAPPADVNNVLSEDGETGDGSLRSLLEAHLTDPACAGCHELMDPIGLGLEHYDELGRYRETSSGTAVDARGSLTSVDVAGPFEGGVELSTQIAQSRDAAVCLSRQMFNYLYGRPTVSRDQCALESAYERYEAEGFNVRRLVESLTAQAPFMVRVVGGEE